MANAGKNSKTTKKVKQGAVVTNVIIYINAPYNNTFVTVTDMQGNVLSWATAGMEFKGARQRTPHAAQSAAKKALGHAIEKHKCQSGSIIVKGIGSGRDGAIRAIGTFQGFAVTEVKDGTGIPHNGCRAPKERRC